MPDYKSLYFKLFNEISDVIEVLIKMQQEAEDQFINQDETKIAGTNDIQDEKKNGL